MTLLVLTLAVAGIWLWVSREGAVAGREDEPRVQSTLHLETFVVNLSDADERSYLRLGVDLGLDHKAKHSEDPAPVAKVRDTILSVLAQAKVDDLLTPQGKTRLKQNLLRALQQNVREGGVEEVYFTEFLIQR